MTFSDDYRRLLRNGGLAIWAVVGLPVFLLAVPRGMSLPLAAWIAAYLLFGAAFALATSAGRGERGRAGTLLLLAGQTAAVLCLVALPPCFGLEGALLVLVALELGGTVRRPAALAWIAAQSGLLFAVIWLHWDWHWGVVLAGAYVPFQLFAGFTTRLLADETALRQRLAAANAELDATRELLAENARVGERVRIARDLHDLLGHHLTALSVNLEVARHLAEGEPRSRIETAQSMTRLLLGDVRDAVGSLRGGDGIALDGALRKLAAGIPQPRVHLEIADGLSVDDPDAARVVLRCAQEIVTNAVRHARAQNLWLEVLSEEGGGVRIRARDDGQGAQAPGEGHGLAGMRERLEERGGSLEVSTAPGRGFTVTVVCPAAAPS